MSYIGADDLVFTNKDGIHSGGFNVQAIMMKGGISPIMTLNSNIQNGGALGKVSSIFEGLAVPAYAYHNNYQSGGKYNYKTYDNDSEDSDDIIDDDLHDKLLNLMRNQEPESKQNKKKNTRKSIVNKKSVTKKNKNSK
jgi:hypothetical protein